MRKEEGLWESNTAAEEVKTRPGQGNLSKNYDVNEVSISNISSIISVRSKVHWIHCQPFRPTFDGGMVHRYKVTRQMVFPPRNAPAQS